MLFYCYLFFLALTYVSHRAETIRTLSTFAGTLSPADDKSIPACGNNGNDPGHYYVFFNQDAVVRISHLPFSLLKINGIPAISIEKSDGDSINVSMNIYNREGKILTEVVRSAFDINKNLVFQIFRPDFSTITVKDDTDELVLYIRYNNKHQITILSKLFYPGIGYVGIMQKFQNLCLDAIGPNTMFDYNTSR